MTRRAVVPFILSLFLSFSLYAQQEVRSPADFLGYDIGDRFTPHHRIVAWFQELAERSPLVSLQEIGETYEGRPLLLVTITSPGIHQRIAEIRERNRRLASGEGDPAVSLTGSPATVWLGFGVHGNESSSAEAAMLVAHTLVTDRTHTALLDDLVVLIDPLQNPDGRERYTEGFRRARGSRPDSDPAAMEHTEPWPGGRFNHYMNDMNRDWAWQSQRETRARVAAYRQWNPQVFVDLHEMSYESSYFFPPSARPFNPNLPKETGKWLETFGRANADVFSANQWPFFVREHFDLFYPGYGDSWPSLRGAIGMTYEMAGGGRAGSAVRRRDGSILTLADRAERHSAAALATVRTAAQNREALLRHSHNAAREQIDGGRQTFLILPDAPNFDALAAMLGRQGIILEQLVSATTLRANRVDRERAETRSFPAGTLVVSTRQALGGLAKTLLERVPQLDPEFLQQQRARTDVDESDEFYDVTAWSLPVAMNVETWVTTAPAGQTRSFRPEEPPAFRPGRYGYIVDGLDPAVYRTASRLLQQGINFSVAEQAIPHGERPFARGSLVVLRGNNGENLDGRLEPIVRASGARIVPLESGWTAEGTGFGSGSLRHVIHPRIALVGGPGSSPVSFGALWHTLDIDTPVPHTVLNSESLRNVNLREYRVLVFPDGNYADRLGTQGMDRIKRWVHDGGTLVAIKGASGFLRTKDIELTRLKPWEPPKSGDDSPAEERYHDFRVPGSAFRTVVNDRSWLTFGLPSAPAVLIEGSAAFVPLARRADQIVTIEAKDPLLSGVAWKESLDRIEGAPYLVSEPAGRGRVITFADDPHFRNFWRGTLPLFLNAVLYSPSFSP